MKPNIFYIAAILVGLSACSSFLDEPQDKRATIDTKEKIADLLVNAYADAQFAPFAEAMSDNADDKGIGATTTRINTDSYSWIDYESVTDLDAPTYYWEASYTAIAHANQALASLDQLNGEDPELGRLRAEALLARAHAHFMLVNFFSMRYDPATANTELGVPYVMKPEENAIVQYKRETIADTYRLIEQDLSQALPLVRNVYKEPTFHFNQKAAYALATRFYLYTANWQKVIEYANVVLGSGDPSLLIRDQVSASFNALTYSQRTVQYSAANERANLLVSWPNTLHGRNFYAYRFGLTSAKYDEIFGDPTTNPFRKSWAYDIYGTDLAYNIPKYTEYFRITNVTAGTGDPYAGLVHFTNDEVLLNRAEAYAMLEQFDKASADLTQYLSQKINSFDPATDVVTPDLMKTTFPQVPGEYTPSYGLTEDQAAFIKGIAEFRRREFYHEGMRWLDIKRFNLVVTHARTDGPDIVLGKDDPRRAIQIPESAKAYGVDVNRR